MRGVGVIANRGPLRAPGELAKPKLPLRLDPLELVLLAAFAIVSLWVLGLDLWQVVAHGRVWTGTDGSYITDQLQYLAWIESASHNLLVANLFVLHGTPADFLQPAVTISGLLTALGMASWLSLLLWKPVAVVALFLAVRAYALATVPGAGRGPRLAIMALALFYGSFTIIYGNLGVVGDLFPGFLSWGYPFALLGIAGAVFAQLSYGRARAARRFAWGPGLFGALAGSMHPWQGEVLFVILIGAELWDRDVRRAIALACRRPVEAGRLVGSPHARLFAVTAAMTAAPLLYYAALDKFDLSWALGRDASKHAFPATAIALALAPLVIVALLGLRRPARNFLDRAVRLWPVATVIVYLQSGSAAGATPLHAFDGVTLPLAVLAVQGVTAIRWQRLRWRRGVALVVLVLATLPTTGYELALARTNASPTSGNANFITADERRALDFLRHDPVPGGVLTRFYLGSTIPARTGRRTYVGDCIWSEPNCAQRSVVAREILYDQLPPAQAQNLVRASRARFILSDCSVHTSISGELGPMLVAVHHFGCAAVYQVS